MVIENNRKTINNEQHTIETTDDIDAAQFFRSKFSEFRVKVVPQISIFRPSDSGAAAAAAAAAG